MSLFFFLSILFAHCCIGHERPSFDDVHFPHLALRDQLPFPLSGAARTYRDTYCCCKELPPPHESVQSHQRRSNDNFFSDILLVIHYNWPHFDTVPFLKELYGPHFEHIVFYGDVDNQRPQNQVPDGVYPVHTRSGKVQEQSLVLAIQQYPGYRGYLFINDDIAMNFWRFERFDKDKFWEGLNPRLKHDPPEVMTFVRDLFDVHYKQDHQPIQWLFRNKFFGREHLRKIFACLPEVLLDNLATDTGSWTHWPGLPADSMYVPGKWAAHFARIGQYFYEYKVWFDIAFPTMTRMLVRSSDIEKFKAVYLGEPHDVSRIHYQEYIQQENVDFVHTIKLSDPKARDFIVQWIENNTFTTRNEEKFSLN